MAGAIGYARVSTDEQMRENNSLAVQKRKISAHCEQKNIPLIKMFEGSESARTMVRPGLQAMLEYCRNNRKKISEVVVSDFSRLARNVKDQSQIIVTLKLLGISKTLNQRAITARVNGDISAQDFDTLKETLAQESSRLQSEITCLDSERNTMEEMLSQAEAQAVDLVNAWKSGNVNQRQELAKAFFPEGLLFSHELRFFEPANTQITEMVMRYLEGIDDIGVPDGI